MSVGKAILAILLSVALVIALLFASIGRQIDRTWMRGDFVADQLEDMDFIGIATGIMIANLSGEAKDLWPPMEKSVNEQRDWIKAEIRRSLNIGFAYFRGETESLRLEIPMRAARENFAAHLGRYLREAPPPDVAGLNPVEKEKMLVDIEHAFVANLGIPDVFVFDLATTPADNRKDLDDVRSMFRAMRVIMWSAVTIALVAAILIVWIASLRWLATVTLIFGVVVYLAATLLTGKFVAEVLDRMLELPNTAVEHLPRLYEHSIGPLKDAALGLIVGGVVLLIVSFFIPQKTPSRAGES